MMIDYPYSVEDNCSRKQTNKAYTSVDRQRLRFHCDVALPLSKSPEKPAGAGGYSSGIQEQQGGGDNAFSRYMIPNLLVDDDLQLPSLSSDTHAAQHKKATLASSSSGSSRVVAETNSPRLGPGQANRKNTPATGPVPEHGHGATNKAALSSGHDNCQSSHVAAPEKNPSPHTRGGSSSMSPCKGSSASSTFRVAQSSSLNNLGPGRSSATASTVKPNNRLRVLLEGLGDPGRLGVKGLPPSQRSPRGLLIKRPERVASPVDSPLQRLPEHVDVDPIEEVGAPPALGWEELEALVEDEVQRFNGRFLRAQQDETREGTSLLAKIFSGDRAYLTTGVHVSAQSSSPSKAKVAPVPPLGERFPFHTTFGYRQPNECDRLGPPPRCSRSAGRRSSLPTAAKSSGGSRRRGSVLGGQATYDLNGLPMRHPLSARGHKELHTTDYVRKNIVEAGLAGVRLSGTERTKNAVASSNVGDNGTSKRRGGTAGKLHGSTVAGGQQLGTNPTPITSARLANRDPRRPGSSTSAPGAEILVNFVAYREEPHRDEAANLFFQAVDNKIIQDDTAKASTTHTATQKTRRREAP
ncbi:unnamed protein product [Amoebophrya sp. A25]|nr:unnamed protein product [Amoebophrya sp. A25]|eukprot:GSA25T00021555001.1